MTSGMDEAALEVDEDGPATWGGKYQCSDDVQT